MMISELIEALQEIQNIHGDIQVDVVQADWCTKIKGVTASNRYVCDAGLAYCQIETEEY